MSYNMNRKFIVNNGSLVMGHSERHSNLVVGFDDTRVTGGGWWHLNREKGIVYLYSSSELYGQVSLEDMKSAVEVGYMTGFQETFKYAFSTHECLGEAMKDFTLIERKA